MTVYWLWRCMSLRNDPKPTISYIKMPVMILNYPKLSVKATRRSWAHNEIKIFPPLLTPKMASEYMSTQKNGNHHKWFESRTVHENCYCNANKLCWIVCNEAKHKKNADAKRRRQPGVCNEVEVGNHLTLTLGNISKGKFGSQQSNGPALQDTLSNWNVCRLVDTKISH